MKSIKKILGFATMLFLWNTAVAVQLHVFYGNFRPILADSDLSCQNSSSCPQGASCRALLVTSDSTRSPSNLATWVLRPKTAYFDTDDNKIFTTDSAAVFNTINWTNALPSNQIITTGTIGGTYGWTPVGSSENCNNYSENQSGRLFYGFVSYGNSFPLANSASADCRYSPMTILCVQQP